MVIYVLPTGKFLIDRNQKERAKTKSKKNQKSPKEERKINK